LILYINWISDELHKRLKNVKIGDPSDKETQLGPIARIDLLENLTK